MKQILYFLMALGLILQPIESFAGKSYSSGSKSSGSSYSGSSKSSSSGWGGSSKSSGSSSYGSGSKSSSSGWGSSSKSSSSPSYSSGSKSSSGSSYSGSSKSSSSPSYSSGSKSNSTSSKSTWGSSSSKPNGNSYNSDLTNSAKKQESKASYDASKNSYYKYHPAPKPSSHYTTPKGESKPLPTNSPHVNNVRQHLDHDKYTTYQSRSESFYGNQPARNYNDFFSPFLMGYVVSSFVNNDDKAAWTYHHKNEMDPARYNELISQNAELKAKVEKMEKDKVARDPNYVLPTMKDNPDLQYNKEFVSAAYNPVKIEESNPTDSNNAFYWLMLFMFLFFAIPMFIFIASSSERKP